MKGYEEVVKLKKELIQNLIFSGGKQLPILPIDTGRYGTPEMKRIFDEENRVQKMLDVEAALAWAHAEVGNIPREDAERIMMMASLKNVKLERIKEIEREIKHDVMALVMALAEACGSSGAYVHLGATSYDIVDTATALQLKEALDIIEGRLNDFERVLMEKALRYKGTIMIGRTHGQHAIPITLGFKFAVWMREISRHIERLRQCRERVLVGKMSGAVGTQAGLGEKAMKIQELVMQRLGLKSADISTQIVQRDRHAELICLLALIAASLENFATEIRELQRPEIGELAEPFEAERQVGSSTMPHKRNPEICERICGLARVVRSLTIPALENVVTWHERDLTQSSAERFIIPEACILVDYMLTLMINVVTNLYVNEERMRQNIELTQGRALSEAIMIALTRKGMNRQEAHELLRKLTIKSELEKRPFREILIEDKMVNARLSEREIDEALNPWNYLGTALEQVELMVEKTKQERRNRGLAE
jgi:adenylosuccinate lyase